MRRRALVIQHVAFEDLGTLAPALQRAGFDIDVLQVGVDSLAAVGRVPAALLIVLGAPIGVYQQQAYPFLGDELELLARRLARGLPTLGICLGAQLMAAALGARVYPGEAGKEIGWSALRRPHPAPPGNCLDPLFEPGVQVLHWHGDSFELPAGATLLASSERYAHQAFALGEHGLALQFHAEVQGALLERWYIGHAAELAQAGIAPAALRAAAAAHATDLERAAALTWRRWLDGLVRSPGEDG